MSARRTYSIAGGSAGKSRLDVLALAMRPSTIELFDLVGVPDGAAVLDVGCGGGDVTLDLARLAGPSGQVVGVDFDAEILTLAAKDTADLGFDNVTFIAGDALALDPDVVGGPFDVAYARFLLSHVADPGDVVRRMAALLRPGGVVVVEDIDFRGALCEPPADAFDRYLDLYRSIVGLKGADATIGPRLPALLDDAGLADVSVRLVQHVGRDPDSLTKQVHALTLDRIRPAVVQAGLLNADDFEVVACGMQTAVDDPRTLFCTPRVFQTWGRLPATYTMSTQTSR